MLGSDDFSGPADRSLCDWMKWILRPEGLQARMSEDPYNALKTLSLRRELLTKAKLSRDKEVETLQRGIHGRWLVLATVLASRAVYTVNWFNISPALPSIANDLGLDLPSRGVLTSSFLLGAGIFQVPAGVLSAKWGPKNTSQLGLLILSISGIGEGLSPTFTILLASRFLLGLGAALFFAPAIGVLTPLFKREEEGFVLGLYNAMFNVGGGLGLFAWGVLITLSDWRIGLVLGGALGLVLVLIGQLVLPRDRTMQQGPSSMRLAVRSRNIWLIALGVIGVWGGVFTTSQILPTFLNDAHGLSVDQGGLIAALIMLAAVFGGPIGGRLSDRYRRRKFFILFPGLLTGLGIALIGLAGLDQLWLLVLFVGFMDAMVFSTMYASASQYPEVGQQYAPLAISVMNSVHILGSFGIPIAFTLIVSGYNYTAGWYFLGGFAMVLMVLILWLEEPFKASSKSLV